MAIFINKIVSSPDTSSIIAEVSSPHFWSFTIRDLILIVTVIVAIVGPFLHYNRQRKHQIEDRNRENQKESDGNWRKRTKTLLTLQALLLVIGKRIKEYVGFETPVSVLPSFRLPILSNDFLFQIVADYIENNDARQQILKTFEECNHLNRRWDYLDQYVKEDQKEVSSDPFAFKTPKISASQFAANTVFAAKVIYNQVYDSASFIEEMIGVLDKENTPSEKISQILPKFDLNINS